MISCVPPPGTTDFRVLTMGLHDRQGFVVARWAEEGDGVDIEFIGAHEETGRATSRGGNGDGVLLAGIPADGREARLTLRAEDGSVVASSTFAVPRSA